AWIETIAAPGAVPPPGTVRPRTAAGGASQIVKHILTMPASIPPKALTILDLDEPVMAVIAGVTGGVSGSDAAGVAGSLLKSITGDNTRVIPVVKPPETVPNAAPKPVAARPPRISVIEMARPIHRVEPVYPALARQMRISGVVELQGVIGTDGRIHELKVLSGHPILIKAAADAVSQWIYAPTILNGQAVEVAAPITVTFKLAQ
ncbi:MAG TPA: energy transducer TonB, partial [Candidatus Solibacter sp.]|nr:energy transducer TonB [Candidatus Solibacter sp.]